MLEASLDVDTPDTSEFFSARALADLVTRLLRVDAVLHDMTLANEVPLRQNRRTPQIEAALEPAHDQFKPAALGTLTQAPALVIDTEAMRACKDVLQLDDARTQGEALGDSRAGGSGEARQGLAPACGSRECRPR